MLLKAKCREWSCLCFLSTRLVIISGNARVEQRQLRSTWQVLECGSKARPQLVRSRVLERRFLWSWVGTLPSLSALSHSSLLPTPYATQMPAGQAWPHPSSWWGDHSWHPLSYVLHLATPHSLLHRTQCSVQTLPNSSDSLRSRKRGDGNDPPYFKELKAERPQIQGLLKLLAVNYGKGWERRSLEIESENQNT